MTVSVQKLKQVIQVIITTRGSVSKTGLLKLLFIVDEYAIKHTGEPITDLDYKIWQHGPVAESVFNDIESNSIELDDGFEMVKSDKRIHFKRTSQERPNTDLLSQIEDTLMSYALDEVSGIRDTDLVTYLHSDESLWKKQAEALGILESLESKTGLRTTDYSIDFKELIEGNDRLMSNYLRYQENASCFR